MGTSKKTPKDGQKDGIKKCFVMMPFTDPEDYDEGHFSDVYRQVLRPAIEDAGYQAFRIDEDADSSSITTKIIRAIIECDMALCDLSGKNPNVLYELGMRQAFDKPVVLIQDDRTDRIFDITVINTVTYKAILLYDDVMNARSAITKAINATAQSDAMSIVRYVNASKADETISDDRYDKNLDLLEQIFWRVDNMSTRIDVIEAATTGRPERSRYATAFSSPLYRRAWFEVHRKPEMSNEEIYKTVIKYENDGYDIYDIEVSEDTITLALPASAFENKKYHDLAEELGGLIRMSRR